MPCGGEIVCRRLNPPPLLFLWPARIAADVDVISHRHDFGVIQLHGGGKGSAREGRSAATAEQGSDVPVNLIDELFAEGMAQNDAAALDEHGDDAALAELEQHIPQFDALHDQRTFLVGIGEQVAVRWNVSTAGEDDTPGLLLTAGGAAITEGEARIILPHRFCTHDDGIRSHAQAAAMDAGGIAGEPLAFTCGTSDSAVEALPGLGDDIGQAGGDPLREVADQITALFEERAGLYPDAGEHKNVPRPLVMRGIGIIGSIDHAADTSSLDGLGAGTGATMGAAGLQGDVDGGTGQQLGEIGLRILDGLHLGMRAASFGMISLTYHTVLSHDDSSDGRIRAGEADATFGLVDSHVHPAGVGVDSVRESHWERAFYSGSGLPAKR